MTTYRKRGKVVRWENGILIRVSESGWARETGDMFECAPLSGARSAEDGDDLAFSLPLSALRPPPPVHIERLLLTHGIAHHEYGDKRWSEETRRLHLSLVRERMRVLVDQATFATDDIAHIAAVFARAETTEREPPPRVCLAPRVTAALLPSLIGLAPPNVRLLQTAGGIDGRGEPVAEAHQEWPNWYRPSYRVRPVRMPLDLRLECEVTDIERDRPRAIALMAPPDRLTVRVLIEDGRRAYPSTVRINRIDAVAAERVWYPYGGGSFGAEMML